MKELRLHELATNYVQKHKFTYKQKTKDNSGKVNFKGNSVEVEEYTDDEEEHESDDCFVHNQDGGDVNTTKGSTSNFVSKMNKMVKDHENMSRPMGQRKQTSCPTISMGEYIKQQHLQQTERNLDEEISETELQYQTAPENRDTVDSYADLSLKTAGPSKKHRGPTKMFDVHGRKIEDRVRVTFNEDNQPIGPTREVVVEFTRFLGTIASDHTWLPLTYTSWHEVPDKDMMWNYVNKKYILPSTAKEWVLQSIACSWRCFKCRIKRDYFYPYKSYKSRWKNRPKNKVPDEHFKILLHYRSLPLVQEISDKNTDNRDLQDNNHTVGSISFAMVYKKLEAEDGPPSKRKMFEETRKRTEGRTYKKPHDDTRDKIERMKKIEELQAAGSTEFTKDPFNEVMNDGRLRLYGRGVSRQRFKSKEAALSSEILETQATQLEEMQKLSKQLDAQVAQVVNMQKDLDVQKEKMIGDIVAAAYAQLRQIAPDISSEAVAQAVASSVAQAI